MSGAVRLAGVDLAWQGKRNPSALAVGTLVDGRLSVDEIYPAVFGVEKVAETLLSISDLTGAAIDAPLIIENRDGQRVCEKEIGREYGSRKASCHTSNLKLYPDAQSVALSRSLASKGFLHLEGGKWQIECYPHPALIEIFGLPERLSYKKGTVVEKKSGQVVLGKMIRSLTESPLLALDLEAGHVSLTDEACIESLAGQALKSNEDALDAILCLYIAGLYSIDALGKPFGNTREGYIWVPQQKCI